MPCALNPQYFTHGLQFYVSIHLCNVQPMPSKKILALSLTLFVLEKNASPQSQAPIFFFVGITQFPLLLKSKPTDPCWTEQDGAI